MIHPLKRLFCACLLLASATAAVAQDRPTVVAVNYPLQHIAQALLGEDADVIFPVPADVDPSFWRPAISDISTIQSADLILLNGAGFATWVNRVSLPRSKIVNTTAAIEDQFIATQSITHSHGDGGEHSHDGVASYTWLDPSLAMAQADAVAAAITARNLAPETVVNDRLAALRAEMDALDAKAKTTLSSLSGVAIITTHPRYQYLARRYGLTVSSLEWDAGAMPDEGAIADLQTLVNQTDARILLWEAEPPSAAFEMTKALGLTNVVFAPLAHGIDGQSFTEAYDAAITALGQAGGS